MRASLAMAHCPQRLDRAAQLRPSSVSAYSTRGGVVGKDLARDQPVALHAAQGQRQHPLRNAGDRAFQVVEAARTRAKRHHDQHRPLVADPAKDQPHRRAGIQHRRAVLGEEGIIDVPSCLRKSSINIGAGYEFIPAGAAKISAADDKEERWNWVSTALATCSAIPRPAVLAAPRRRSATCLRRSAWPMVGLDYFGIGEHHTHEMPASAATVVAGAAASVTKNIIGSAVTVLSTDDPVRVYQQF